MPGTQFVTTIILYLYSHSTSTVCLPSSHVFNQAHGFKYYISFRKTKFIFVIQASLLSPELYIQLLLSGPIRMSKGHIEFLISRPQNLIFSSKPALSLVFISQCIENPFFQLFDPKNHKAICRPFSHILFFN